MHKTKANHTSNTEECYTGVHPKPTPVSADALLRATASPQMLALAG